eukprot:7391540-Prymnesium_polylepis.2
MGVNVRWTVSVVIGQPSGPKPTSAFDVSGAPLSLSSVKGGGASASVRRYSTVAYSKPAPNCSIARQSGERSM